MVGTEQLDCRERRLTLPGFIGALDAEKAKALSLVDAIYEASEDVGLKNVGVKINSALLPRSYNEILKKAKELGLYVVADYHAHDELSKLQMMVVDVLSCDPEQRPDAITVNPINKASSSHVEIMRNEVVGALEGEGIAVIGYAEPGSFAGTDIELQERERTTGRIRTASQRGFHFFEVPVDHLPEIVGPLEGIGIIASKFNTQGDELDIVREIVPTVFANSNVCSGYFGRSLVNALDPVGFVVSVATAINTAMQQQRRHGNRFVGQAL